MTTTEEYEDEDDSEYDDDEEYEDEDDSEYDDEEEYEMKTKMTTRSMMN